MLKLLISAISLFCFFHPLQAIIDCAPQLQSVLITIRQLPEACELINTVLKDGPIKISVNQSLSADFGAFWGLDDRTIFVNGVNQKDFGETIGSVIFELYNAVATRELKRLDALAAAGKIDKFSYVRAVEYVEYCNSLKASEIVSKGIKQGIYPIEAHLPIYPSFEEHFYIQKKYGHSAWIAKNFDEIVWEAQQYRQGY
ncbi:hypothetical protein [Parachlamydia sp. AcF125]|uniref:hypothetical protein n=1 Tax=Parachlamydia sp. AcF125 TaxID=2795736 RepID=UPI001BC91AA5|nr:hypothetical protein [Parachlamydia sp. AcF125]MBS4168347.1 hypothetical protein [Parachlamydia sp. AcF125]